MAIHLAVDIGGTFTDVIAREGEATETAKVPTTPEDFVRGVRNGITTILSETTGGADDVSRFVHGTTVGTNTVIERDGGTVGLLMTDGFRDILAIGRQKREDLYDLFIDEHTPTFLCPRDRRYGIEERIDDDGNVSTTLDEEQLLEAVDELVNDHGVNSIGVCYLFSFLNPSHEKRTRELIESHYPRVSVSLSSEINPKFREYERLVVTAFDAYLRPVIETYVENLDGMLDEQGVDARLQIIKSRGGITNSELITEKPVSTVLSGPSAAVKGAVSVGSAAGFDDLITFDMGGTSCDVSLIHDGSPHITGEGKVTDYPLRMQMIDVSTIGSGGGSVAWLDSTDRLHVGPQSAGANPGPVCYGRGGSSPTVTDAAVVLGYLNPDGFADGAFDLDADAAAQAIESQIAEPLGYTTVDAAKAIFSLVNAKMSEQLRLNTVQRGHDPREFTLFAMGGAGPLHAAHLAEEQDISKVLIPPNPGVLSATGLLAADIEHIHEQTYIHTTDSLEPAELNRAFQDLLAQGETAMDKERVPGDEVMFTRSADMQYDGQSFEIEVPIPNTIDEESLARIEAEFHSKHEQIYGHKNPDDRVEFVNLRVVSRHTPEKYQYYHRPSEHSLRDAVKTTRTMDFVDRPSSFEVSVYDRAKLPTGTSVEGPAAMEQSDTTVLLYPGQSVSVDERGNLIVQTA